MIFQLTLNLQSCTISMRKSIEFQVLLQYVKCAITELEKQQASEDKRNEPPLDGGRRLALACCIVYLSRRYRLNIADGQVKTILEACLVCPNESANLCPDYEQLRAVYFVEEQWCR